MFLCFIFECICSAAGNWVKPGRGQLADARQHLKEKKNKKNKENEIKIKAGRRTRGPTYLLLRLWRHPTLHDFQSVLVPRCCILTAVANGKAALAQQLADLVKSSVGTVRAAGLQDLGRRRRRMLLVLGGAKLRSRLGLDLGRFG